MLQWFITTVDINHIWTIPDIVGWFLTQLPVVSDSERIASLFCFLHSDHSDHSVIIYDICMLYMYHYVWYILEWYDSYVLKERAYRELVQWAYIGAKERESRYIQSANVVTQTSISAKRRHQACRLVVGRLSASVDTLRDAGERRCLSGRSSR